jgi:3-methyladenine DNA glycosylase AlkD
VPIDIWEIRARQERRAYMATVAEILVMLQEKANPEKIEGMASYGMTPESRLGVSVPDMRAIAKQVGKDHQLALELWASGYAETQIVAGMIADPNQLTEEQMDSWVVDLNSWDTCDQVCMNLFDKSPLALKKVRDWSERDEEFVKRAAYALIACLAWHDKRMDDLEFIDLFLIIKAGSTDNRNYVKKAVNWALRNIGKRNLELNQAAIKLAQEIQGIDSRAARWIAADALRELQSEKVHQRLVKKAGLGTSSKS